MKSDQSVPLSEALERFSDPSDWQEFSSLGFCEYQMFFLGAPETESDRRDRRARQLKERLEAEFLARLTAGSLQASGFVWPKGLKPKRRTIPGRRWQDLEPDFTTSEATGGGFASSIFGCRRHRLAAAHLVRSGRRSRGRIDRSPNSGPIFGAGCCRKRAPAGRAGKRSTTAAKRAPDLATA
jgi:hypothetical protein